MKELGIALLCLCSVAYAAGSGVQKWRATSTTSISVTGDVGLSGNALYFANGKSLNLKQVAGDQKRGRYVYQVVSADNPVLMNGNTLCGPRAPAHLFVERNRNQLNIAVFDNDQAPALDFDVFMPAGACATYHYER